MTDNQQQPIGYLGSGRLYQAVQPYLEQAYQVLPLSHEDLAERAPMCSLLLSCDDGWRFQTQQEINRCSLTLGIPWLRASTEFEMGIVGPCVFPAKQGCLLCAEIRRLAAMKDERDFLTMRHTLGEAKHSPAQPWLTASSLEILAQLVLQEVTRCQQKPEQVQTRQAVLCLELETLQYQRHRFLPEPACPACGHVPPDTAEAATMTLQSRPKSGPDTYRVRQLSAIAHQLFETYTDVQMGLIHTLTKTGDQTIAKVNAEAGIRHGERQRQLSGSGRTLNYEQSRLVALAEALERYGGQWPKGKQTVVQASYRQLGEQALDPTTLGLPSPEQYTLPHSSSAPYHPDLIYGWVWGYSFLHQRPILVPEQCAYYGLSSLSQDSAGSSFIDETSNGCALGNCLEEAIFYGILEVAERDACLMTWYAQLSLPRLDLPSATDPRLGLLVEHIEQRTGYTIHVFNSTLDHGIPCCWLMAVDEHNRPDKPKVFCYGGSHPHPEEAVIHALLECDALLRGWSNHHEPERAQDLLANPLAVQNIHDHVTLYLLPEAFERLSFFADSQQQQTFQEAFGQFYHRRASLDLRDDLSGLIEHYLGLGIDIIVVDQTTPEHAAHDFRCVKVIMPGMLPLTFGHRFRRISGLPRLSRLPSQLGYRTKPLTDAQINPHPHPFC